MRNQLYALIEATGRQTTIANIIEAINSGIGEEIVIRIQTAATNSRDKKREVERVLPNEIFDAIVSYRRK